MLFRNAPDFRRDRLMEPVGIFSIHGTTVTPGEDRVSYHAGMCTGAYWNGNRYKQV